MKIFKVDDCEENFFSFNDARSYAKQLLAEGRRDVKIFSNGAVFCTVSLTEGKPVYTYVHPA